MDIRKILRLASLVLGLTSIGAGSAPAESPCDKVGPYAPKIDKDLLRKDLREVPIEVPIVKEEEKNKQKRTPEQAQEAERGVCQDTRSGKTIDIPEPLPGAGKYDKGYPGGNEGDPSLPRGPKREGAAGTLFQKAFVFGNDDRVLQTPTTTLPFRMVVKLRIKFPNTPSGQAGGCTGSLIGSMHVLTAGHCVFNSSKGGWATAILVIPGADGVTTTGVSAGVFGTTFIKAPFGIAFAVAPLRSVKCWTQSGETPDCDYGLITLNKTFNVGAFGLLHLSDDDLDKTQAYIIGYPGELGSPPGLQEFFVPGGGTIWAYDSERVEYKIDVTSGNSGSPVYRFWNGNRAVFSIHTTSVSPFVGSDYNAGPRITTARYNQIRGWQCADAPCP